MAIIKGVLFDKDGTIIDLEKSWLKAYRMVARELATLVRGTDSEILHLQREILERSSWPAGSPRPLPESPLTWAATTEVAEFWISMPEFKNLDPYELTDRVLRSFADGDRFPPEPAAPLPALMIELENRAIRIGLATMDRETKARSTLRYLSIDHHFHFVSGADSGWGLKPEPGMVNAFCQTTGLHPREVLVVGDTHADMLMARAAGAGLAVAVLSGGGTRASLEGLADHVIDTVRDLPDLLD